MKRKKLIFVFLIVAILLGINASAALAISGHELECRLAGGEWNGDLRSCTFRDNTAFANCTVFAGKPGTVEVWYWNNFLGTWIGPVCIVETVSASGEPVDLYSGNCGAYIGYPPPGGVSLTKIHPIAFLGKLGLFMEGNVCQLNYAEGYVVSAWVYYNLTQAGRAKYDNGDLTLVVWQGGVWVDCGATLIDFGDHGRLACSTTSNTWGLMR